MSFELPPGQWGLETRPELEAGFEERLAAALVDLDGDRLEAGLEQLAAIADDAADAETPVVAVWARYRYASALIRARQRSEADAEVAAVEQQESAR